MVVDYGSYGLNSIHTPQSHSFTGLLPNTSIQLMKANYGYGTFLTTDRTKLLENHCFLNRTYLTTCMYIVVVQELTFPNPMVYSTPLFVVVYVNQISTNRMAVMLCLISRKGFSSIYVETEPIIV